MTTIEVNDIVRIEGTFGESLIGTVTTLNPFEGFPRVRVIDEESGRSITYERPLREMRKL